MYGWFGYAQHPGSFRPDLCVEEQRHGHYRCNIQFLYRKRRRFLLGNGYLGRRMCHNFFIYGGYPECHPGNAKHPYGWIFKNLIRPRLGNPTELEDAAAPQFAQGVGLFVAGAGVLLHMFGVPNAVVIAASAAFFAAFLNAVFNYCLGCQIYFGLKRLRVIR